MATSAALQRHSSASATHLRSAAADTGHTGWRRSDCTCSLPQLNQMRSWHASTRAFCGSAKTQCTSSDAAGQIKSGKPANVSSSQWQLEYTGVVSSTIKTLKRVSLGTAAMSMIGSPLYLAYAMDGTYGAVKVFSATGFTCFGLFTTGVPSRAPACASCTPLQAGCTTARVNQQPCGASSTQHLCPRRNVACITTYLRQCGCCIEHIDSRTPTAHRPLTGTPRSCRAAALVRGPVRAQAVV